MENVDYCCINRVIRCFLRNLFFDSAKTILYTLTITTNTIVFGKRMNNNHEKEFLYNCNELDSEVFVMRNVRGLFVFYGKERKCK